MKQSTQWQISLVVLVLVWPSITIAQEMPC